jgi:predicted patatin/cPLA2 family phospholipase
MEKTGLVLEGGGMRGAYTAGILDAFLDMGIHFKDIIGVSAGAANALSYISLQHGRNREIYRRFAPDDRYLSFKSLLKTGSFFGMDFVFYEVPRRLLKFNYDVYRESDKILTIVATDVDTGKPFYRVVNDVDDDGEMQYLCASAAIPMASTIYHIGGRKLMDGGASDSIPIEYSIGKGNTKNVVVVTRRKGYRARKNIFSNFSYLRYPTYRKFARTVANRFGYYNHSLDLLEELEASGRALVFYPSRPVEAVRFEKDPGKLLSLYQNGYDDAAAMRERLSAFLADSAQVELSGNYRIEYVSRET